MDKEEIKKFDVLINSTADDKATKGKRGFKPLGNGIINLKCFPIKQLKSIEME